MYLIDGKFNQIYFYRTNFRCINMETSEYLHKIYIKEHVLTYYKIEQFI